MFKKLLPISVICFFSLSCGYFLISGIGVANASQQKLYVTEIIPGANCQCVERLEDGEYQKCPPIPLGGSHHIYDRLYECSVQSGLSGFSSLFKGVVAWIVNIVILLGVMAIAALGIAWAMAGDDDPEYKKNLKEWLVNIIIGLLILFLFSYILTFIAPWVYK